MSDDFAALTDAIAAAYRFVGKLRDFVELAKAEVAVVANETTSPTCVSVRWPSGYEMHIFATLPEDRLRVYQALRRYGQSTNQGSLEAALDGRH